MENVTGECMYVYNSATQKRYFLFEISSKKSNYSAKTGIILEKVNPSLPAIQLQLHYHEQM